MGIKGLWTDLKQLRTVQQMCHNSGDVAMNMIRRQCLIWYATRTGECGNLLEGTGLVDMGAPEVSR